MSEVTQGPGWWAGPDGRPHPPAPRNGHQADPADAGSPPPPPAPTYAPPAPRDAEATVSPPAPTDAPPAPRDADATGSPPPTAAPTDAPPPPRAGRAEANGSSPADTDRPVDPSDAERGAGAPTRSGDAALPDEVARADTAKALRDASEEAARALRSKAGDVSVSLPSPPVGYVAPKSVAVGPPTRPPPEPVPGDLTPYRVNVTGTWDALPPGAYTAGQAPRSRRRRTVTLVIVALIVAIVGVSIGLAVSGGGGPSAPDTLLGQPQQIVADATTAAAAAHSVTIVATGPIGGRASSWTVVIGPGGGTGTVDVGGNAFRLVTVGQTLFVQGTAPGLTLAGLPVAQADRFAGTWLAVGPRDQMLLSSFRTLLHMPAMAGGLVGLTAPYSTLGSSGTGAARVVAVGGLVPHSAVTAAWGDPAVLSVADATPYLPVKVAFHDSANGTTVDQFFGWGQPVAAVAAPVHVVAWRTAASG